MSNQNKKIIVAMSGGVDSSMAAALLKKQGYEVTGVFMRLGNNGGEAAARKVAEKLDIEFLIFDFRKEFKKEVINYFLSELAAGRTPNPCAVCNPKIKFGLFLKKALALGAPACPAYRTGRRQAGIFIATGHYAAIVKKGGICHLLAAKDKTKDQSYFLSGLKQNQLSRIIFPLGDLKKEEVIKLAKKIRLPYQQEESFDLCFVANDTESFVKKYLKMKPGKIFFTSVIPAKAGIQNPGSRVKPGMTKEIIIGQHQGLPLYTIGQRANIGGPGPFYIIRKDIKKNILYVSNNEKDLYGKELQVRALNWLSGVQPKLPMKVLAKIRYRSEAEKCTLRLRSGACPELARLAEASGVAQVEGQKLLAIFEKPQRAITPGQSVVFYNGKEVIGGGVIKLAA